MMCARPGILALWAMIVPMCAIAAPERIELNDVQALQAADIMMHAGELNNAQDLLNDILGSDDVNIRTSALFQLGRVAIIRGDYSTAQRYFLAILKWHPDYTNVRLELAYSYFLAGDYNKAEFNFRLVLGDKNLSAEDKERVARFISLVRRQKNWSVNAGLSLVPDSNLNYVSDEGQECIDFGFGPMCRQLEREKSGVGVRYNLGADYYLRLTDRFGIRNTVSLSALDFATSRYDDYALYIASGPRYVMKRAEISLQPFVQMRWYGGKYYNTVPGLRLDSSIDITVRLSLGTGIAFNKTIYYDEYINDVWTGYEYSGYIQPRYYINNKSFLMAGIEGFNSTTREPSYGNYGATYSVGYFGELPWTLSLFARFGVTRTRYKEAQFFIMPDYNIDLFVRKDWLYQFNFRLSSRYLEYRRLYPSVGYTYTLRDSNAPSYKFDKHRIELELNYRF